jgi:hypothetical protein
MNNIILKNFINNINHIYSEKSIYRSTIIVNNNNDANNIYNDLVKQNYSINIINNTNSLNNLILNYNNLNERMLIIKYNLIFKFIFYLYQIQHFDVFNYIFLYNMNKYNNSTFLNFYYYITNNNISGNIII